MCFVYKFILYSFYVQKFIVCVFVGKNIIREERSTLRKGYHNMFQDIHYDEAWHVLKYINYTYTYCGTFCYIIYVNL